MMHGRTLRALAALAAIVILAVVVVLFVRPVLRGIALLAADIALAAVFLALVYMVVARAFLRRPRPLPPPAEVVELSEAPSRPEELPAAEMLPLQAPDQPASPAAPQRDKGAEVEAELRELKRKLGRK